MDLALEQAKLEFGMSSVGSLPILAAELLVEGSVSSSLSDLSVLTGGDEAEIRNVWSQVLSDLSITVNSREDSAWLIIHDQLDRIISGLIQPYEGTHLIIWSVYHEMDWSTSNHQYVGDSIGIEKLYELCDTYDELSTSYRRWDSCKSNQTLLEEISIEIYQEVKKFKLKLSQPTDHETLDAQFEEQLSRSTKIDVVAEAKKYNLTLSRAVEKEDKILPPVQTVAPSAI